MVTSLFVVTIQFYICSAAISQWKISPMMQLPYMPELSIATYYGNNISLSSGYDYSIPLQWGFNDVRLQFDISDFILTESSTNVFNLTSQSKPSWIEYVLNPTPPFSKARLSEYQLYTQIGNKVYTDPLTNSQSNVMVIWDLDTLIWTTSTSPNPLTTACVSDYGGKIYFLGGSYGASRNTIQIYDIFSGSWSSPTSYMPSSEYRQQIGCAIDLNGEYIYYAGGLNTVASTWITYDTMRRFDITLHSFDASFERTLSGIRTKSWCISNPFDTEIICAGGTRGCSPNCYVTTVDIYNYDTDVMSSGPNITAHLEAPSVLFLPQAPNDPTKAIWFWMAGRTNTVQYTVIYNENDDVTDTPTSNAPTTDTTNPTKRPTNSPSVPTVTPSMVPTLIPTMIPSRYDGTDSANSLNSMGYCILMIVVFNFVQ